MIIQDILTGFTLGVAAGLSPGPLMALLIAETLKGHRKNGFLVAISPVITDIPILIFSLIILDKLKNLEHILGLIYFAGAGLLIYLGIKNLFVREVKIDTSLTGSLKKGVMLNILNPYTYLFWFFIGAPYVSQAGIYGGIGFTVAFFIGISGSMGLMVIFVEKMKKFIRSRYYLYLLRFIGLLFIFFGLVLAKDGLGRI
ncbi:MAG: LysE family transporter [Aquificae bacterium]|nr:LysE family transporter [Aquificota bacterium]